MPTPVIRRYRPLPLATALLLAALSLPLWTSAAGAQQAADATPASAPPPSPPDLMFVRFAAAGAQTPVGVCAVGKAKTNPSEIAQICIVKPAGANKTFDVLPQGSQANWQPPQPIAALEKFLRPVAATRGLELALK